MRALRSSRVVLPDGVRPATVLIDGDQIVDVLAFDELPDSVELVELAGALLPGLVDSHVHVNDPGRSEWEGWETAGRAAAAGGVTTVVDMPLNSSPVTTTVAALDAKRVAAERCIVDAQFWGGAVPSSTEADIDGLARAGARGFKCFLAPSGIDEFEHVTRADLERLMPLVAATGLPLLAHAELVPEPPHPWIGPATSHAAWAGTRPASMEHEAVAMLVELAERTGCRVHVVHVSSAASVPIIERSPLVTWETCPHYFAICGDDVPDGATQYKCAPPLRSRPELEALWQVVLAEQPAIVSDHSPAPPDTKAIDSGSFQDAWGGIASVGLQLPLLATALLERGIDGDALLERLARQLADAPARIAGLTDRGRIEPGMRADLVEVDVEQAWTIRGEASGWRWPLTPYEGRLVRGRARATWVAGEQVAGEPVSVD